MQYKHYKTLNHISCFCKYSCLYRHAYIYSIFVLCCLLSIVLFMFIYVGSYCGVWIFQFGIMMIIKGQNFKVGSFE